MKLKAGTNTLTPVNIFIAILSLITVLVFSSGKKKQHKKGKMSAFVNTFSLFTYIKDIISAKMKKQKVKENKAPLNKTKLEDAIIIDL